jgi:Lon protease-like protein
MASEETDLVPLFPLHTVLFPGMVLSLHIFEERYWLMVRRCLDEGLHFGVLLIREGKGVGEGAVPYDVGTTARIAQVEPLPNGRMNIQTIGLERFRVRRFLHGRAPYLQGEIEPYPLLEGQTPQAIAQAEILRPLVANYIRLLAQTAGLQVGIEHLPEDPIALAFLAAVALQISHHDKQQLLMMESAPALLAAERRFLRREERLLRFMLNSAPAQEGHQLGPSGVLSPN